MDIDKKRRRQNLRVIISEAIMVLVIGVTVVILALIVSGYWLSSDFKVERQGMLQIASTPSGATFDVDGESSWFQRTNTSKILASGEHVVTLTKDGYDSWTRKINISEGLLYRIHYPRLFLTERTSEKVFDASKYTFASVSPNYKRLLLVGDTTEWNLLRLDSDTIKGEKLDVSAFVSDAALPAGATVGVFDGEIISADWDQNSEHVLLAVDTAGTTEWILIDTVNVANSINLSKEFGVDFDTVKIFDNSASTLLAIEGDNLRKIDTRNQTLSSNLVKNVLDFDYYDNEIVFSALDSETAEYYLGTFRLGDTNIETLETFTAPFRLVILQFYEDKYIATLSGDELVLHARDDYDTTTDFVLSFAPTTLAVGHQGEFITMTDGTNFIATLDMEDGSVREWSVDGETFGWLDDDMIFSVADGELFVYDFDGLNRRLLAKNTSEHFPVTITNNKWLYYFSDGHLIREVISK